jgi:hypothetical protein
MKLTFTLHDVQEISSTAYITFVSRFRYISNESESDFNPDTFGCGERTVG